MLVLVLVAALLVLVAVAVLVLVVVVLVAPLALNDPWSSCAASAAWPCCFWPRDPFPLSLQWQGPFDSCCSCGRGIGAAAAVLGHSSTADLVAALVVVAGAFPAPWTFFDTAVDTADHDHRSSDCPVLMKIIWLRLLLLLLLLFSLLLSLLTM